MTHRRAHHKGSFDARGKAVRAAAWADPDTPCARCGRTIDQHPPHKNGRPPFWTAGHVVDGAIEGELVPEVSTCNFAAGARTGNRRRRRLNTSRDWFGDGDV